MLVCKTPRILGEGISFARDRPHTPHPRPRAPNSRAKYKPSVDPHLTFPFNVGVIVGRIHFNIVGVIALA